MAKKDLETGSEDIERSDITKQSSYSEKCEEQKKGKTEVKNAHASGVGSMGMTDETQSDQSMDQVPGKPSQDY